MTTSNKMKIDLDPRILANQQKILAYLSRLDEESHRQRHAIELFMREQQHFQKDVYHMLRKFDQQQGVAQESMEEMQDAMENIGGRTRSIHKHVKLLRNAADAAPDGEREFMWKSLNVPASTSGRVRNGPGPLNHEDENNSESDNDGRNGARRKNTARRSESQRPLSDPNLLPPSNFRYGSDKMPFQPKLSPLTTEDFLSRNMIGSPVQMQNLPPNVPKPDPRNPAQRFEFSNNILPGLSSVTRTVLPGQPVIQRNPQERDFINLMRKVGMDVNPSTVAAVTKATHGNFDPSSQTVGLHTVLILDTSSSMQGEPLRTMKTFVSSMIDTIDRSALEQGLEEQVALVTCGATTTIVQGFTNNYIQIKNMIGGELSDRLPVEGRTPLMTALVLTLCYLELRGECIDLHGYRIPPRVIVISDFHVTNDKSFTGPDTESNTDRIQVQSQIFTLMHHFRERRYPVFCVPVGEANPSVYDEIVKATNGQVLSPSDVDIAGSFYKFQYVVGEVLFKYSRAYDEGREEDLEALAQQTLASAAVSMRHKDIVMELLTRDLESSNVASELDDVAIDNDARQQPEMSPVTLSQAPPLNREPAGAISNQRQATPQRMPTPMHQSRTPLTDLPEWTPSKRVDQIPLEERADLPQIGSRVVRGPDWKWQNQDGKGPGTIVGHVTAGLVFVLFDNAEIGRYRYNYHGKEYDVVLDRQYRQVPEGHIEIGCWVTRGPDWARGDEDGGSGTVGVVVRKLADRQVQVRWPSRVIETYKFGNDNKWELAVTDEPPRSVPVQQTHLGSAAPSAPAVSTPSVAQSQGTSTGNPNGQTEIVVWKWKDGSSHWRTFSSEANQRINMVSSRDGRKQLMVQYRSKSAKIYLEQNSCEIDGQRYQLQSERLPLAEVDSLYEVEKYLPD